MAIGHPVRVGRVVAGGDLAEENWLAAERARQAEEEEPGAHPEPENFAEVIEREGRRIDRWFEVPDLNGPPEEITEEEFVRLVEEHNWVDIYYAGTWVFIGTDQPPDLIDEDDNGVPD